MDLAQQFVLSIALIISGLSAIWYHKKVITAPPEEPKQPPVEPLPVTPTPMPPTPKYDWSTVESARHSVRVICDEEGLTVRQKNELCATVGAESGWQSYYLSDVYRNGALIHHKGDPVKLDNLKNGVVWSTDYGIAQINTYFHIGKGKTFPTPQYVLDNPEACIRWMCAQWKAGHEEWWIAYKTGAYKAHL